MMPPFSTIGFFICLSLMLLVWGGHPLIAAIIAAIIAALLFAADLLDS
jgi:asparagine N-glycosylation enzyme membrane subunit Stt3